MSVTADAMDQADVLVAEGRCLEAIALLTEANHRHRDPAVEVRLVNLRHQAFAEVADLKAPGEWPPAVPDLYPEVDGIPDVAFDTVTPDHITSAIQHHGAVLVRDLLPPQLIDRLLEDVTATMDAIEGLSAGEKIGDRPEWFTPFSGPEFDWGTAGRMWVLNAGTVWAPDSPRTFFDLVDAIEEVGLKGMLVELLGEGLSVSATKFAMRRVPPDATAAWHQDSFLGADTRTINVWISLSDCGSVAPGLDILPRRLTEFVERPYGPPIEYVVANETVDELAKEAPVIRPEFHPGDGLIFDQFLLHQTGWGPGLTEPRFGFECWFFEPSSYPPGNAALVI